MRRLRRQQQQRTIREAQRSVSRLHVANISTVVRAPFRDSLTSQCFALLPRGLASAPEGKINTPQLNNMKMKMKNESQKKQTKTKSKKENEIAVEGLETNICALTNWGTGIGATLTTFIAMLDRRLDIVSLPNVQSTLLLFSWNT